MSNTVARRNRFLGVLAVCAGAVALVGAAAGGCGGSVNDGGGGTTDSGVATDTFVAPDTLVLLDGAKDATDSSKPPVDSAVTHYDAPGSLFDVDIPDLAFEGGTTSGGCYDCTKTKCKDELTACDKDEQCRGIVLCLSTKCAADPTDFTCALGCAADYGVTSPTDPVAAEALAVGQCTQKNCADKCPGIGGTDAGPSDAKSDTKTDGSASDGGSADAAAFGPAPKSGPVPMTDPAMIEYAKELSSVFAGNPTLREAVVERMTH